MLRSELFQLERMCCQALLSGDFEKLKIINTEIFNKFQDAPHLHPKNPLFFEHIKHLTISKELIDVVHKSNEVGLYQDIDTLEGECRNFVETELGVSLDGTRIARLDGDFDIAEAYAQSCGERDHIIVFPQKGMGFESPDLLVHELAHAAEYTIRRETSNDDLLFQHKILSEAVAHYCQYKYLIEHGNTKERIGALGSLTREYFFLLCILACLEAQKTMTDFITIKDIENNKKLSSFIEIYGKYHIEFILNIYKDYRIIDIYNYYVEPRFGALLAIKLLKHRKIIREICLQPPHLPIKDILLNAGADAEFTLNFADADNLLWKFIRGEQE